MEIDPMQPVVSVPASLLLPMQENAATAWARHSGMSDDDFLESVQGPAPAVSADASVPMEVEVAKPASEFLDPLMEDYAKLIRGVRVNILTDEEKDAREKAANDEKDRKIKEVARKAGDPDTPYGRKILEDIKRTFDNKKALGIPGSESINEADLKESIRKGCTFVSYTTDDGEDVTCSLLDLPVDVEIENTVEIFAIRKYQTEAAVKVFKNLLNHRMSLLTFGVGKGKTNTALAAAIQMVKLELAKNVAVVAPNQLVDQWHAAIKTIAGPGQEVVVVDSKTIKDPDVLLYQIHGSKAPLVFVLICSSLLRDWDNDAVLEEIFRPLGMPWVVLDDECQLQRRKGDTISTSMYGKIFGDHFNIAVSATPFVKGTPGTEETAMAGAKHVTFDARPVLDTLHKPREHTVVDPRGCSAEQLLQMFKGLSVGMSADDAKPSFPPGAIYNVMVDKTQGAKNPGMELQSHGMHWGENNRLLAAVGLGIECHLNQEALKNEDKIDKPRNVVIVVNCIKAINDIAQNLSNLGYADKVVVIHGQLSDVDCAKNVDRLLTTYGLIAIVTPGKCGVGLNAQHTCSTFVVASKSYVPQEDEQLKGRIFREGQEETPILFYMTSGDADERVEVLADAKTKATAEYYDVDPNTKVKWSLEPTRSITNKEFRTFVQGVYAAAKAGFAVNTHFAAPIWNSMLHPPTKEQRSSLDTFLKSYVCPKVQRATALPGFELDY